MSVEEAGAGEREGEGGCESDIYLFIFNLIYVFILYYSILNAPS